MIDERARLLRAMLVYLRLRLGLHRQRHLIAPNRGQDLLDLLPDLVDRDVLTIRAVGGLRGHQTPVCFVPAQELPVVVVRETEQPVTLHAAAAVRTRLIPLIDELNERVIVLGHRRQRQATIFGTQLAVLVQRVARLFLAAIAPQGLCAERLETGQQS